MMTLSASAKNATVCISFSGCQYANVCRRKSVNAFYCNLINTMGVQCMHGNCNHVNPSKRWMNSIADNSAHQQQISRLHRLQRGLFPDSRC